MDVRAHEILVLMTLMSSKVSAEPAAHKHRLIRAFASGIHIKNGPRGRLRLKIDF